MRRLVHAFVGWAALVAATLHQIAVVTVAVGRPPSWLGPELVVGLSVQLAAVWMIRSAARLPERDGGALLSTALLALVCLWQLIVWEAAFPAVFLALATLDGVLLTLRRGRDLLAVILLLVVLGAAATAGVVSIVAAAPEP